MKTIGFVIPWFAEKIPGGAEMELRGLTQHLHNSNVSVEIITTCVEKFGSDWNVDYYPEGIENINGIDVRRFKVRKRNTEKFDWVNFKFMNNLPVSIEDEDVFLREMVNSPDLYDYICEHEDEYSLFVFIPYMFGTTYYGCDRCLNKSVIIPCLHDESYAYIKRFKERYSTVKGMIFHSKSEYELAHRIYDLSQVRTAVLGGGVDTGLTCNADNFRSKYNIDAPFIVYAGRKDSGKNVDTLIKYFRLYKKRSYSNLKLVLLGGGRIDIPQDIKEEVYDLGFVPLQDKYDAYAASEFLCNPSKFESFSLVIMECWLCRRPVLVYGGCDVTRNFAAESNGGLYFNNYPEFELCVNYILNHKDNALEMGEKGREYVLSNFAWNVVIDRYMKFFATCCSDGTWNL